MHVSEPDTKNVDVTKLREIARACACTHLRKAARTVTQVFDEALRSSGLRATQFTLLVTSRSKLHIRGETVCALSPLATPDLRRLPALDELAAVPAVELFIQRAHAASAGFALTSRNASAVARICTRLEGLPLAIELVAARCSLLSPQQLLAQLEQPLSVLTNGPRDYLRHHRTLRDAIEWSFDLLNPPE